MLSSHISIVVVNPTGALRDRLVARLHTQPDFVVTAMTDGTQAGRAHVVTRPPDVLLINARLGDRALELLDQVNSEAPATRAIIIDTALERDVLVSFLKGGARGFVAENAPLPEYERAIRAVVGGAYVIPPAPWATPRVRTRGAVVEVLASVHMTARERYIAQEIASGITSNEELAARLGTSVQVVQAHLENILEKLTLHTRLKMATHAMARPSRNDGRLAL